MTIHQISAIIDTDDIRVIDFYFGEVLSEGGDFMTGKITVIYRKDSATIKVVKNKKTTIIRLPIRLIACIETPNGETYRADVAPALRASLSKHKRFVTERNVELYCDRLMGAHVEWDGKKVLEIPKYVAL